MNLAMGEEMRYNVVNGEIVFRVPRAFQLFSPVSKFVYKIVFPFTENIVNVKPYRSRSGMTSSNWYIVSKDDHGIMIKPIRGLWFTYHLMAEYNKVAKITREDLTDTMTVRDVYGRLLESVLEKEKTYLVFVNNYGFQVYDRFKKAETLMLPTFAVQGHLEVYKLNDDELKDDVSPDTKEYKYYNHKFEKQIRYVEVGDGVIVYTEEKNKIVSSDHENPIELDPGFYLLVHPKKTD